MHHARPSRSMNQEPTLGYMCKRYLHAGCLGKDDSVWDADAIPLIHPELVLPWFR